MPRPVFGAGRSALAGGLLAMASFTIAAHPARSAQFKVIYQFAGRPDGSSPSSDLLVGPAGTLFGETYSGGAWGWGTVFELVPPLPGRTVWTGTILYSFHPFVGGNNYPYVDGAWPTSNLVMDKAGNLYGTTVAGVGRVRPDFSLYYGWHVRTMLAQLKADTTVLLRTAAPPARTQSGGRRSRPSADRSHL